jgi:hypothetical protein
MKKNLKAINYAQSLKHNIKPYMKRCPVKRMAFHRIGSRKQ